MYILRTETAQGERCLPLTTTHPLTSRAFYAAAQAALSAALGTNWTLARVIGENGWKLGEVSRN